MEGPKFSKRRKLGKNKKKSWRGIDITETEDFLEDERFQLRTTGLVAEKTNDQLFVVERQRSDSSAKEVAPKRKSKQDLNCYSNLVNRSRIQCPRKEYPTSENYKERTLKVLAKKAARKRKATASASTEQSKKDEGESMDLWGEEKTEPQDDDYFNEVTKRKRVEPPEHIKRKCSERAVVETPHPGTSINPAYGDHQDLLLAAYMVEFKKQKAETKLFNALDAQFPSAAEAPTEATWLEEMSAGLYANLCVDNEEDVDDRHISLNPPVNREKKKKPSEKRKQKAAKLLKHVTAQEKFNKERENKVYSITKMRSELAKEKKELALRAQEKAKKQEEKKYTPKKLGKTKVEVPELELKLSEELVGNLRSVKPEGHLLEDRYKSLQMRNLIEPRSKVNKKKTKKKKFEKKSFREVTI